MTLKSVSVCIAFNGNLLSILLPFKTVFNLERCFVNNDSWYICVRQFVEGYDVESRLDYTENNSN